MATQKRHDDKSEESKAEREGAQPESGAKSEAKRERPSSDSPALAGLPDGLRGLDVVHTATAEDMVDAAEALVAMAREKLGSRAKPRLGTVEALFEKQVGKAPAVDEDLDKAIRKLDVVERTAALDRTYDTRVATALNELDKKSNQSGSDLQSAYDAWVMARRIYESNARSAGAIFQAEIRKAKRPPAEFSEERSHRDNAQVRHYRQSSAIGAALVQYQKTMAAAAGALATAFGQLIGVLYKSFADTAVAEATFLSAANAASLDFWSSVQKQLSTSSAQ